MIPAPGFQNPIPYLFEIDCKKNQTSRIDVQCPFLSLDWRWFRLYQMVTMHSARNRNFGPTWS